MVASVSPAGGASNANPLMYVTAKFNEAIDSSTLTTSTFQLVDSLNNAVAATVRYNSATQTAILIPNTALNQSTSYTTTLVGGSNGIKDSAGNPLASNYTWSFTTRSSAPNPIIAENQLQGTPQSTWDIGATAGDPNLQGFTDNISYNLGDTVNFKVSTISKHYRIDIYRLGYYGGNGAALKGSVDVNLPQAQVQPAPINDASTGLNDFGNWAVSGSWQIPTTAVSGVYVADLIGEDGQTTKSQIVFVVRSDSSTSDILFQTADSTWQAYNDYGGASVYGGSGPGGPYGSEGGSGRAYKVSYNRPLNDRGIAGGSGVTNQFFWGEYPMVYWLEQNGYNVSYFTDVDADRYGSLIKQHQIYVTSGHDEYWSGQQRANVTAARDAGVNLAFFSGNEAYWKTRLENAFDGSNTGSRTLVTYKETLGTTGTSAAKIDPLPDVWTGTWRDPRFSPPADGGRPENALDGTIFTANRGINFPGDPIQVPSLDGGDRLWRNTFVSSLQAGQVYTSALNLLGYEWDSDLDNGFRPAGLIDLSSTTQNISQMLLDYGNTFGPGTATHSLTLYRANSGALVFGAGTVQWSWGLANIHDGGSSPIDPVIQQATVNLFADMGVQPGTLQAGLTATSASTDRTPPSSTITAVGGGGNIRTGYAVTIKGTAVDHGGGVVAGIEVSTDGGQTWHPATGHESWSYTWTPTTAGQVTIQSRATDDSGNIEVPSAGTTVTVVLDSATPPQITNVLAAVQNNTTVTITWNTDENANSQVDYGTNPNSLSSTVTDSTMVTSHSITLNNLQTNTLYYYRVTSTDQYNHSTTVPPSNSQPNQFSTPAFSDATTTDFGSGTATNTYISKIGGGEVILDPTVGTEFPGTALPPDWFGTVWSSGGAATVGSGLLTVDGARAGTNTLYSPSKSLEFVATFSGQAFQNVGFGVDFSNGPWAMFGTGAGGALYARTNNGTTFADTLIPGNWFGTAHDFRIDWTATQVNYTIDGILIASHGIGITASMRPLASDFTPSGGAVTVSWLHMSPYIPSTGSFASRIFDAGGAVTWTQMTWVQTTPASTSVSMSVRMGNTATPDSSWTDWVPVSTTGNNIGGASRYLQYQAYLSTSDSSRTPGLQNVTLAYNTSSPDTYPPRVVSFSPAASATNVSPTNNIVVKFSELMNAASFNSSSFYLQAVGSNTNVSATVTYQGSTATLTPTSPLVSNQQYQVTLLGSVTDASGNALGSNLTWNFTTGLIQATDASVAAFSGGTPGTGAYISQNQGGEVILAPTFGTEFSGTTLPAGMTSTILGNGGAATVANNSLTLDGDRVNTNTKYGPGTSIEFSANFSGDAFQHAGFGNDLSSAPWAIFSTGNGGALYARTNSGSTFTDTLLAGNWLGALHRFRIDWTSTGFTYSIDGTQVASHSIAITAGMSALAVDTNVGGGTVVVNWMHVTPYAASGTFVSRVFDAGQAMTWNNLSWNAVLPSGTSLSMYERMGNTPTPDSSWTSWVPIATSGGTIGGVSRYFQYEAVLATTVSGQTPELQSVTATYEINPSTFAPTIIARSPAPGATQVDLLSSVNVSFDELMNSGSITPSTFYLQLAGSSTNIPSTLSYSGSTATLTPNAPLTISSQYQVTLAGSITDTSGNQLGSTTTWTFNTRPGFTDASVSAFNTGTPGAATYVTKANGGEVILAPTAGSEFSGTSLDPSWFSTVQSSGGAATVGNGLLTVDGARAGTNALYGPGSSLEFMANFSGDAYEHAGFGTDFNAAPWAIFSTGSGGALYARSNNGSTFTDTLLAGSYLGAMHDFRIDWTSSAITYYIDGTQVASHAITIASSMRPLISDLNTGGGTVTVNWLRLAPYAASGTYLSRIVDGGSSVTWDRAFWNASTPTGTSLALYVRMGNSPTPDSSWTDFVAVSASGNSIGGLSRYLQYEVVLTTNNSFITPALQSLTIDYSTNADTIAPHIAAQSPAPGATGVDPAAPITVTFSELMNSATITPSTVFLQQSGSSTNVAATLTYSGSTATLTPSSPLLGQTQYQITVKGTITDTSGNAIGSDQIWTFTTGQSAIADNSTAAFNAGTTGSATYVTKANGGEVILAPTAGSEFSGTSLDPSWFSTVQSGGGAATVGNGLLTVDGARAGTNALYGPGSSLEFMANFSGDAYEHAGFGTDFNAAPWAIFSTGSGGALYARSNNGSTFTDTLLAGSYLGAMHDFRIDWTSSAITYYIDGTQVASHAITIASSMRPLISDLNTGGGTVTVSWLHLAPYAAAGTYQSRIIDAGSAVNWSTISWTDSLPTGTSLSLSVRMGNTATPDSTWTDWVPMASSGSTIGGVSRYLQYEANLATTNSFATPALQSVTIQYSANADTIAPHIAAQSPAPNATNVNPTTNVTVTFSELMNTATINGSTVQLTANGSSNPVTASVSYTNSTATLTPTIALAGNTQYQVSVSGSIKDSSGNALGSNQTWNFTTGNPVWSQTTAADFNSGTQNGTTVTNNSGGEVQSAPAFTDDFSGTTLSGSWTSTASGGGQSSVGVSGSILSILASEVDSVQTYSNVALEGSINFGASPYQHFGLATGLSAAAGNYWALFSTGGTSNTLFARVNVNGATTDVSLGALPAGFHDYLIKPVAGGFQFSVDGVVQATISATFPTGTALKIVMSNYNGSPQPALQADWVRVDSYTSGGTFVSSVYNATRTATWGTGTWDASLPAGTSVTVMTRSGNTATPDGTWSAWSAVSNGGTVASPSGQYLQYEVIFNTTDSTQTAVFQDMTITWS